MDRINSETKTSGARSSKNCGHTSPPLVTVTISKLTAIKLSVLFAIIALGVGVYEMIRLKDHEALVENIKNNIGLDGLMMFTQHDRDNDGYLSILEFEPLALIFHSANMTLHNYSNVIEADDEMITVRSYFNPLQLGSMTKNLSESMLTKSLFGLLSWKSAAVPWRNFGVRSFKIFMPPDVTAVGKPYDLITVPKLSENHLSSNRFYAPKLSGESVLLHQLLSIFHPRPFLISRFEPRGSIACVRAYNEEYMDIEFRIHAEFQLNKPPSNPFWFTPAQFKGNIIMTRSGDHILQFRLFVPTENMLNVDMEWLNDLSEVENMEVDIGYTDLMELNISSPSQPAKIYEDMNPQEVAIADNPDLMDARLSSIIWNTEISRQEATASLERQLFKFKQVQYYKFPQALQEASTSQKLVHLILMWGALDDQSC